MRYTLVLAMLFAQAPDPPPVSFEAASIRQNMSGESNVSVGPRPGGRFVGTNVPVALLVTIA